MNIQGISKKALWFIGGAAATLSLTVLLTNFIHPDRYAGFRGHNPILSFWNEVVSTISFGAVSSIFTNAFIAMICAAVPMFYIVIKNPAFANKGQRQKLVTLLALILLPFASILFAGIYKPYRDPALSAPDRSFFQLVSEWGSNLMYGGVLGLFASLAFALAVILIIKPYRWAILITLGLVTLFQVMAILG